MTPEPSYWPDGGGGMGMARRGRPGVRHTVRRVGQTKRQKKLEQRRLRDAQREAAVLEAAGEPVLVLQSGRTKVRAGRLVVGRPLKPEIGDQSSYAKRLRDARRFLGLPDRR